MTKEERLKAFSMRLDGAMWEQIGAELGYSPVTVRDDLSACMREMPKKPNIPWKGLRKYVEEQHAGSIKFMAIAAGIKPSTMYAFCSTGKISDWAKERISGMAHISETELFGGPLDGA